MSGMNASMELLRSPTNFEGLNRSNSVGADLSILDMYKIVTRESTSWGIDGY